MSEFFNTLPPQDAQLEAVTLAAILTGDADSHKAFAMLSSRDFYSEFMKDVFRTAKSLHASGASIDMATVFARMKHKRPDCAARLSDLFGTLPGHGALTSYCQDLRRLSHARRLRMQAAKAIEDINANPLRPASINDLRQVIDDMCAGEIKTKTSAEIFTDSVNELRARVDARSRGEMPGVSTGFRTLDELTGGLVGGIHFIAGWASAGKSAVLTSTIEACLNANKAIRLACLDMRLSNYVCRLATRWHDIPNGRMLRGELSPEEIQKIEDITLQLQAAGFSVTTGPHTAESLRDDALANRGSFDILVVDTINKLGAKGNHLYDKVCNKMQALNALAKELEVPILLLAQLKNPPTSEEVEKVIQSRKSKNPETIRRPTLNDIEGGRVQTQDAETVTLIWRENYGQSGAWPTAKAELHLAKSQIGRTGRVPCTFIGAKAEFVENSYT